MNINSSSTSLPTKILSQKRTLETDNTNVDNTLPEESSQQSDNTNKRQRTGIVAQEIFEQHSVSNEPQQHSVSEIQLQLPSELIVRIFEEVLVDRNKLNDYAAFRALRHTSQFTRILADRVLINFINSTNTPLKNIGVNTVQKAIDFTKLYGQNLRCLNLEGLYMGYGDLPGNEDLSMLGDEDLSTLISFCPHLDSLTVSSLAVTDEVMKHIATLTRLTNLDLTDCKQLSDAGLQHIAELKELTKLNLSSCNLISDAGLQHVAKLTELTELTLYQCELISDVGVEHIAVLKELIKLNLSGCYLVTDDGLQDVATLKKLIDLNLSCCDITDDGLKCIKTLTDLESLELISAKLTDKAFLAIKALKKLNYLNLFDCQELDHDEWKRKLTHVDIDD